MTIEGTETYHHVLYSFLQWPLYLSYREKPTSKCLYIELYCFETQTILNLVLQFEYICNYYLAIFLYKCLGFFLFNLRPLYYINMRSFFSVKLWWKRSSNQLLSKVYMKSVNFLGYVVAFLTAGKVVKHSPLKKDLLTISLYVLWGKIFRNILIFH